MKLKKRKSSIKSSEVKKITLRRWKKTIFIYISIICNNMFT